MWLHSSQMKKIFSLVLTLGLLASAGTGCVSTVDGHKRAGVPFQKDRIVSRYEFTVAQIFDAAKVVLGGGPSALGVLHSENRVNNSLVAKVNDRTVYVKLDEIDAKLTQITVQVRTKAGAADIDLAAEVDKQIALHLR
jgi:hypothetical protein